MNEVDLKHIKNMAQAAHAALVFAEGKTQERLFSDTRLVFALVKALDLVGNEALNVSTEGREQSAQIDWQYVTALPGTIYQENDDIDLSVVWNAVTNHLPTLIAQLQHLILIHS
jgi:uncharacterized protein with HEPN domain